jgi:hypothetical protein
MREKGLKGQKFDIRRNSRGNPGEMRVQIKLWWWILLKRFNGNFLIPWSVQKM